VKDIDTDAEGNLYVLVGAPDVQVKVFDRNGEPRPTIGRKGGRAPLGPWDGDGMVNPVSLCVASDGNVWVAEASHTPKRFVVWDSKTGERVDEFFGPTHYGASGGAINPRDPMLMVGSACEWRLDPETGRAACLGVFDDKLHGFACFREGANGRLYLFAKHSGHLGSGHVTVFERLGDGQYARRAELRNVGRARDGATEVWTDANGDGAEQEDEIVRPTRRARFIGSNGWSLNIGPGMGLYSFTERPEGDKTVGRWERIPVAAFNDAGAPVYDIDAGIPVPGPRAAAYNASASQLMPAADGSCLLANEVKPGERHAYEWACYRDGELLWTYPNPFFQVHGSHRSPGPTPGLFRGGFGIIGIATLPAPVGNAWVINTNCGEWHVLNQDGFYVTRLFEPDPFQWNWPEGAVPGAPMDAVPPGSGGEDFGGSATQAKDGILYVQSGKSAYWNIRVDGWDAVAALAGGSVSITEADRDRAGEMRIAALQRAVGRQQVALRKTTPEFTGNLRKDFPGAQELAFSKQDRAGIKVAAAWDEENLYVGWHVDDTSPWINGADDAAMMYAAGDTVDLQLRTDPGAPRDRGEGAGDLRVSIGNFRGEATAVLYRKESGEKRPRTFSSGVVEAYEMDYVAVLAEATVKVTAPEGRPYYVVEAAIPLASLGLTLSDGLKLRGDFGATHSDPAGLNAVLRTYWSNQDTGLIDDVVFEVRMKPQNFGEILFRE
jgi:hypothetical protein